MLSSIRSATTTAMAALALCAGAHAQAISASFNPNPVAPGVPVTVTAVNATGADLELPSPCGWYVIHAFVPGGANVTPSVFCPQVIVPVPSGGSFSYTWDQKDGNGVQVPPGVYWFELKAWDAGFTTLHHDYFCISIQSPPAAALTNQTPAKVGATLAMQIDAPLAPGAFYLTLASFTSNNPLPLPSGGLSCLDFDALLQLTLGAPNPLYFPNFRGFLDGSGKSSGLALNIPALPVLANKPLKVQSFMLTGSTITPTNGLSFAIAP